MPSKRSLTNPQGDNRMINEQRKLGLALSGGGFRASFFHIGVMARLAEKDLLRSIEVLSCVSGGSIIGALYYLHVKRLLESKQDRDITKNDFVTLMQQVEVEFLRGVQTNLRVRAFSNFGKNWRMLRKSYSRSDRMAELYDKAFYDQVAAHPRISLTEVKIQPLGANEQFHPRKHNKDRRAKVPMLVINATTLNTGRSWQFTAVDMGEREPEQEVQAFDKNLILSSLRFDQQQLPDEKYRHVPLSVAVAASACVPGIFPPLALTGLYPNVVPQLVDGGVHDNQGISSILYEQCTDIVVSDASGQLESVEEPKRGTISILGRTNGILMARVRNQGLESLHIRQKAGEVEHAPILHLKEEVALERLEPGASRAKGEDNGVSLTSYGMNKNVQRCLSEIRTDLDSFTDTEAFSLMFSGYMMAGKMIGQGLAESYLPTIDGQLSNPKDEAGVQWRFVAIRDKAESHQESNDYTLNLRTAHNTVFKVYSLGPKFIPLGVLIAIVGLGVPLALVALACYFVFGILNISPWWFAAAAILLILPGLLGIKSAEEKWGNNVLSYVVTGSIALGGSLLAYLHLKFIDPIFLKYGRVGASLKSTGT